MKKNPSFDRICYSFLSLSRSLSPSSSSSPSSPLRVLISHVVWLIIHKLNKQTQTTKVPSFPPSPSPSPKIYRLWEASFSSLESRRYQPTSSIIPSTSSIIPLRVKSSRAESSPIKSGQARSSQVKSSHVTSRQIVQKGKFKVSTFSSAHAY